MHRAVVILLALGFVGCPDAAPKPQETTAGVATSTAPASAAPASTPTSTSTGDDEVEDFDDTPGQTDHEDDRESACAPVDPKLKPMLLLGFKFTASLKGRDPGPKLNITRPGDRVYAHLRVRNRSGRERCLRLVFRVHGKKRTAVTLKIGKSWRWRTWAYNTTRPSDRGPLELEIHDDQGKLFTKQRLAIVPK